MSDKKVPLKHYRHHGGCDHEFEVLSCDATNDLVCPQCKKKLVITTPKRSYILNDLNFSGTNIIDFLNYDIYWDNIVKEE